MARNVVETVMGAAVLAVAVTFVFFAYRTAQIEVVQGYTVTAPFSKIGGLKSGSDVRINGIKVGTVVGRWLDDDTFDAMVRMSIQGDVKLPVDTIAAIGSEGIVGGKYVRLEPGTEENLPQARRHHHQDQGLPFSRGPGR